MPDLEYPCAMFYPDCPDSFISQKLLVPWTCVNYLLEQQRNTWVIVRAISRLSNSLRVCVNDGLAQYWFSNMTWKQ